MAMLKPIQSYSGGVIVKPYTGNIAQELQFRTGEKKKTNPILRLGSPWQPSNKRKKEKVVKEQDVDGASPKLLKVSP